MTNYLIDTHILLWLISEDTHLDKNIREDIDYFQHQYYVSVETLREILLMQVSKKAIAERYTLVSADTKFPSYRDYGLELLVNSY